MDHHRDSQIVSGRENEIAIFAERIHAMPNRVKFQTYEIQLLDASFHFTSIRLMVTVRAEARETKKSSGILRAKLCNLVVGSDRFLASRKGLHDRNVDRALLDAANQLFLGGCDAKNATASEVRMRVDHFYFISHQCLP